MLKTCTGCGSALKEDQFYTKRWKNGTYKMGMCIACTRISQRAAYKKIKKDPRWRMLKGAKDRARKRGTLLTITREDIVIPRVCPYLKTDLHPDANRWNSRWCHVISLDRIDNSKGYTPDNIEVVSLMANRMKTDATPLELVNFSRHALSHFADLSPAKGINE